MIKPILIQNNVSVKSNNKNPNTETKDYKDPLMKWPLRGAAFTNEVGEGLRPIIGSYATLFWAPVFLYIGADIYDKYKNNGTEYDPNSARLIKEASFQGLASVLLPLATIKGGQNLFSLFGLGSKNKIAFNSEEKVIELAKTYVANGNMRAYENNEQEGINKFKDIVKNNLEFKKSKNFISKTLYKIQKALKINTPEKIEKYAENVIKELIETRKLLLNPTDEFKTNVLFSNYELALNNGETKSVATKSVLTKMLNNKTLKSRFIKTIGGFIAIGFAINPIDKFVEHTIINKYLGPKIDKIKKPEV